MSIIQNKKLKRRILDLSYKYKLSHIGSCITAVDIIDEIFKSKKPDEKFVLSSGHAGLALYCILEREFKHNRMSFKLAPEIASNMAERIWLHHGVHPDRCINCGIDCSAGSLGQGLPIAVGMALSNRKKNVYCLISDGESSEGSIWEALRIANEQKLKNLHVYVNINGWGAYKSIESEELSKRLVSFFPNLMPNIRLTDSNQLPFLNDLDAHYHTMTEEEYKEGLEVLI